MNYLKNYSFFPISIIIIISLFSCQPENKTKPIDDTYTIDTIYITKDTNNYVSTGLWIFNDSIPLRNIETIVNNGTTVYLDSASLFFGNLVSRITCVNNIIKSIYTVEPDIVSVEDHTGNADFYSQTRLDSVAFYDFQFPFNVLRRTFIPNYTNNNLDSLAVNIDDVGDLGFNNVNYGNMLHFKYSTYDNQKNLIGLDVNEFLYLRNFFCKWHTMHNIIPYGQHIFFMDEPLKSLNTNCKNLLSEIHRSGEDEYIVYTFDPGHSNRMDEIQVNVVSATDNYTLHYKFHYKPNPN